MLILPLNNQHDRSGFDCGNDDLNQWFNQVATQHKRKLVSMTFVATETGSGSEVFGFYAISLVELLNADIPATCRKKLPLRVPAFRLGRLAVSTKHQRRQVGKFLLFDAIDRVTRISQEVGGAGLVVDAKTSAVNFYQRYGFEAMESHPDKLFLSIGPG